MAIAKTPKTTQAKPAAAKPASAAKTPEDAVVHSTAFAAPAVEAAPEPAAPVIETVASPKAVKDTEEQVPQGVETLLEFNRDNAILLVSAGNELALGWHKLSQSLIDWSAESCDKSVAGATALLSAKTVEEVLGLSQELACDSLQQILKESSEIGTLSSKLFENAFAPLAGRMVANVEKLAAHTH